MLKEKEIAKMAHGGVFLVSQHMASNGTNVIHQESPSLAINGSSHLSGADTSAVSRGEGGGKGE